MYETTSREGITIYSIQTARKKNGLEKYVVVDNNYKIFRPLLMHSNRLYASHRINTTYNYLSKIVRFLNYLNEKDMEFDEVTESTIVGYINYLQGYQDEVIFLDNTLSGSTINGHLTAIAGFYETLEGHSVINDIESPFIYKEGFRPSSMNKEFLHHAKKYKRTVKKRNVKANSRSKNRNNSRGRKTRKEIDTFRSFITNERDLLMFDLMYNTGMRIGEVLNLQIYDYSSPGPDGWGTIDVVDREVGEYGSINVAKNRQTKTGGRTIVVYNELLERIDEYLTITRPYVEDEIFLFVSEKGINKGRPFTKENIEKKFRDISEQSEIKITPHNLRHTHITELTEAGYDPLYISLRAGHSNIESTATYQHPSIDSQAMALLRIRPGGDSFGK